jgi:plastocyanin
LKKFRPLQSLLYFCCAFLLAVVMFPPKGHAETWKATVGAQSHDKGRQALAFLPNEMWIHAGDSITWTFNADEIHTVTFLTPSQPRPPFQVGCPGVTPSGSSFNDSMCVTTPPLTSPNTYTVTFPSAGNFKLVCLVHENMTGLVHVLNASQPLPHNQAFYDRQAAIEARDLITDTDNFRSHELEDHFSHDDSSHDSSNDLFSHDHSGSSNVIAGIGEIVATPGGQQTLSIVRFIRPTTVIHVGQTVEWANFDPITPHTITFGAEPANPIPPSSNVTVDEDGARHAVISAPNESVHSGFIIAAPQERIGLPQAPITVTRFRVTFTETGTFPFICVLHDNLGMMGKVVVVK